MDAQKVWNIAYSQLELQFDRASFDTWLRGAFLVKFEDGVFVIGVRNNYVRDMLQHRLYRNVQETLSDVYGETVTLRFEVRQPDEGPSGRLWGQQDHMPLFQLLARQQAAENNPEDDTLYDDDAEGDQRPRPLHERIRRPQRPTLPESELIADLRFDRFIVTGGNRVAYEAARAIADEPARAYNPFVVYGGVGLGKTHLLQSIAHVCQGKGLRVIYIPAEVFTNDLVAAIRSHTTAMFRDKYRLVDVLLVDDVQFIGGKDSTQEEFFHTFNALYTFNKQIVLSSDRHPQELKTLEDRLRSRFEGGLVTDVQPLDYEARLALLNMWVCEQGIHLGRSVLEMIAERGSVNVRELRGLFNSLVAKTRLESRLLTVEGVESALRHFDRPRHHGKRIAIDGIIEATARYYQVKPQELRGKRRTGRINTARQMAMYLARELTDLSLPQIGDAFGGRSHTTVLHGCNKITEMLDVDSSLQQTIEQIQQNLLSR